ncbi:glutathione S-transferase N-terminal domain-containing protein [Siccirubricoccus sp. KC 17139]|uniref:Glutathione S-transferase N-terminal domain-containing protein n=1 Tax=Siccirubricoccus soli TaxID=2899147 RepID=A0ABT1CZ97_9PROT|nr:glutathione binding-like protein [Siccirubricoccus soli]MCO6414995.1 glutathione S-transferase N-terminal domain-containing protein [Siccirubricoccus soli]MCP2681126.1 glutathione S-transferase N-terminal domain-containing protein [Siccirubricoccus soli]
MKLYDSIGPNPRVVRIFMAERGVEVPRVTLDLMGGENRQPPHLARNPMGQMPCLELDDGSHLSEIIPICEYLDEITPGPSLIGATPQQRAETRMWVRRIDLNIVEPLTNGFRFSQGLKLFKDRVRCLPEAAEGLKAIAQDNLAKLDQMLAGRQFVCQERLTLADILLFAFLDFGNQVRQPINPEFKAIAAHHAMMAARPSAQA